MIDAHVHLRLHADRALDLQREARPWRCARPGGSGSLFDRLLRRPLRAAEHQVLPARVLPPRGPRRPVDVPVVVIPAPAVQPQPQLPVRPGVVLVLSDAQSVRQDEAETPVGTA